MKRSNIFNYNLEIRFHIFSTVCVRLLSWHHLAGKSLTAMNVAQSDPAGANLPNFIFSDRFSFPAISAETASYEIERGLLTNRKQANFAKNNQTL